MYEEIVTNLTWAAPYIGALIVLPLYRTNKAKNYVAVFFLFLGALSSTLLLLAAQGSREGYLHYSYPWIPSLKVNLGIYADSLSTVMAFIVAWLSFFIGFYSLKYLEGDPGLRRYWFFFDFFVGSMLLLVLAGDLITMFIGWEGTGLASYALIGFWYRDEEERWVGDPGRKAWGIPMYFTPSHGGVRAIVFTRIGDVGFLAGIAMLYFLTGSFSLPVIVEHSAEWGLGLYSRGILYTFLITFSLGAMAKSAQFPFHEWLVTAMTGPTSVSALIHAATMVKAGVYFMLRFMPIFYLAYSLVPTASESFILFFTTIASIGAFTAFLMATQAIVARELKLVLAFSTASQLGYMFLAAGTSGLLHEFVNGFLATFNHLMSHAIFKASLFLAAGAVIHAIHSRFMTDAGGLSKYMKITFVSMLLAVLSLSGVPPFMGFWSKDGLLEAAFEARLYLPYAVGVVTAALTAFYSLRMIAMVFFREESKHTEHVAEEHGVHEAHPIMATPYFILALISLGVGAAWPLVANTVLKAMTGHVLGIEEVPHEFEVHLDPVLTGVSLGMVSIGFLGAYTIYISPRLDRSLGEMISVKPWASGIYNFLYDRWYINALYYIVLIRGLGSRVSRGIYTWFDTLIVDGFYHKFLPKAADVASRYLFGWFETPVIDGIYHEYIPKGTEAVSRNLFKSFETPVIDEGYNVKTVRGALGLAGVFRRVQTGKINHYLLMLFTGSLILIIVFMLVVGL
ncbi:MAG: NADH-quinone oxidoreductase subunit L [Candidatus Geothermarchaeales archaeon]